MQFRAYRVTQDAGNVRGEVCTLDTAALPPGELLIRVAYSSLNYKDALAAAGHRGVTQRLPHIPGIDAAGIVVESAVPEFKVGDAVVVTGFDFGMNHWGGYAEYARVPAQWALPLPPGLSLFESMALGTAGLTAALCVDELLTHAVANDATSPVVVSGASGGVGSIAVAILAQLGFTVAAISGKADAAPYLQQLGAAEIVARSDLPLDNPKPLLSERWAGGVDSVGGALLTYMLKALRYNGSIACCGLTGGSDLATSVYPFILRGVRLLGVDSAQCSLTRRSDIWRRLAQTWKPRQLAAITKTIDLNQLPEYFTRIRAGALRGRTVVVLNDHAPV